MIRWILVFLLVCGAAAHAQDALVRLKLSTWIPPAHYVNVALKDWASDIEQAGRVKVAAMPGHDVYKLTPDQIAVWRKAAEPLKTQWAANVKGADPQAVYGELVAALKQHGALAE